jgi:hypothetical protein
MKPINCAALADAVLVDGESRPRFLELVKSLETEFQPETPTERILVSNMAVARWRLMRNWALDSAGINHEQRLQSEASQNESACIRSMLAVRSLTDSSRRPEFMSIRESHFDRQYHRALERLLRFRAQKVVFQPKSHQPIENTGTT